MAIALWYCPAAGSYSGEILQQLVNSIQTLYPNSPVFQPHLTVTSNLVISDENDVKKILSSCVACFKSVKSKLRESELPLVNFNKCCIDKSHYFKKVYLQCDENKYLYSIALLMREMFVEIDDQHTRAVDWLHTQFKPHVSLLYSEVSPVSKAHERMVKQRVEDTLDTLLVPLQEKSEPSLQAEWLMQEQTNVGWSYPGTFKIVSCVGPVKDWEVLGSVDV